MGIVIGAVMVAMLFTPAPKADDDILVVARSSSMVLSINKGTYKEFLSYEGDGDIVASVEGTLLGASFSKPTRVTFYMSTISCSKGGTILVKPDGLPMGNSTWVKGGNNGFDAVGEALCRLSATNKGNTIDM